MRLSAMRTDGDIIVPGRFQQLSHGKSLVSFPKTPLSLKFKNESQVSGFHPVVQESVITDLLKPRREYMHEKTSDEFRVFQSNRAFRFARFSSSGRERCFR